MEISERNTLDKKITCWEEQYGDEFKNFLELIKGENPDFIIPVARKSCKLFGSWNDLLKEVKEKIFYRDYFNFNNIHLENKKIVVVDDAACRTSTLKGYRNFFVHEKGASEGNLKTLAFVGHSQLIDDPSSKCDGKAKIFKFLSPLSYTQYLMLQSDHFILKGVYQDIDHLVLEAEVTEISSNYINELWDFLGKYGYRYRLAPVQGVDRFGIHSPSFFSTNDVIKDMGFQAEHDFVEKIRFTFLKEEKRLLFVPMIFPKLFLPKNSVCNIANNPVSPFNLPCHERGPHKVDESCYRSISLLLSVLLARKFFTVVRESPALNRFFEKTFIKKDDLTRYLGKETCNSLVENIKNFLQAESISLDASLKSKAMAENYDCFSPFSFGRKNVHLMLEHLRDGYKNEIAKNNNNPVGVKKCESVESLLNMGSGTHPLIFAEIVDELCDFGIFVPCTEYLEEEGCWKRLYRTGEDGHDELPWGSAQAIVPFAIQILNHDGVESMYLEKTLANFICDFPRSLEKKLSSYPECHCLISNPSYWGPQAFAFHPVMYEKPLSLDPPTDTTSEEYKKWRNFAKWFDFDRDQGRFISTESVKGIIDKCVGDRRKLRDYFLFLSTLKMEVGNVEALNALTLCRTKKRFYKQLHYNIGRWRFSPQKGGYIAFLDGLQLEKIRKDCLDFSATMAESVHQKLKLPSLFKTVLKKGDDIVNADSTYTFYDIWEEIKSHMVINEALSLDADPDVEQISKIINAIRTLDGLTRLKLDIVKPEKKKKTEKKVKEDGPREFKELDIDIDIEKFLETKFTLQEIGNILSTKGYQRIISAINQLPLPEYDDLDDIWNKVNASRLVEYFRIHDSKERRIIKMRQKEIDDVLKKMEMVNPKLLRMDHVEGDGDLLLTYGDVFKSEVVVLLSMKEPYGISTIERTSR